MRHCKDSEDDRDDRQDKQGDLHRTIGPFALHLPVAGVDVIRPRGNVSPFDRGSLGIALGANHRPATHWRNISPASFCLTLNGSNPADRIRRCGHFVLNAAIRAFKGIRPGGELQIRPALPAGELALGGNNGFHIHPRLAAHRRNRFFSKNTLLRCAAI